MAIESPSLHGAQIEILSTSSDSSSSFSSSSPLNPFQIQYPSLDVIPVEIFFSSALKIMK
jgi:hypothetical protein